MPVSNGITAANFTRGFCLALDNIAKAIPAGGKELKPVRYVNGKPVFRFRVEAIRYSNYLTTNGEAFGVTAATLKHWTNAFKEFKGRKIPVPFPREPISIDCEHNRGNVIRLTSDGRSLWADVELIGKDAPRIAARKSRVVVSQSLSRGLVKMGRNQGTFGSVINTIKGRVSCL